MEQKTTQQDTAVRSSLKGDFDARKPVASDPVPVLTSARGAKCHMVQHVDFSHQSEIVLSPS